MIRLTPRAARQVRGLNAAYRKLGRPAAIRNLVASLRDAVGRIGRDPDGGLPAPRPYPALARIGQAWIKAGPYWIRYSTTQPPTITAVFHERANIPGRV